MYRSVKNYDTFSTCFRQWKAEGTHCKFLHGYGVAIELTFEGKLDNRNWVVDFGAAKRSDVLVDDKTLKNYLDWLLDHTTIVAEDDPELEWFKEGEKKGILRLRILKNVGCERFAEFIFEKVQKWVHDETNGNASLFKVKVSENNRNSAEFIKE